MYARPTTLGEKSNRWSRSFRSPQFAISQLCVACSQARRYSLRHSNDPQLLCIAITCRFYPAIIRARTLYDTQLCLRHAALQIHPCGCPLLELQLRSAHGRNTAALSLLTSAEQFGQAGEIPLPRVLSLISSILNHSTVSMHIFLAYMLRRSAVASPNPPGGR